jgi:hypothetical protein
VPLLVLDEQLCGRRLIDALGSRGLKVKTVKDFGAAGRPDPEVVRRIDERCRRPWVLITMDFTIVEDFPGFDWDLYAIAWVVVREDVQGAAFEHEKNDVVHRHAHQMVEQRRGDHHSYTVKQRIKGRPSLTTLLRRRL